MDSSASRTVSPDIESVINFEEISGRVLKVTSGHTIPILGFGTILLGRSKFKKSAVKCCVVMRLNAAL